MNVNHQAPTLVAYIRLFIATSCVVTTSFTLLGVGTLPILIAAQLIFALSLPWGYRSLYGVAFYGVCWGMIWLRVQHDIDLNPEADERGLTRAVFLFANIGFLLGLGLSYAIQVLTKFLQIQSK